MFNQSFAVSLRKRGYIPDITLQEKLQLAETNHTTLYSELLKDENIDDTTVYKELADYFKLPLKDVQVSELDFSLIRKFPRDKLIYNKCLPYKQDNNSVTFVISNPLKMEDITELKHEVNKEYYFNLISEKKIDTLLNYISNKLQQQYAVDDANSQDELIEKKEEEKEETQIDAPVITLCNSILRDAVTRGASDIHIEPFENEIVIRYRIDGKLVVVDKLKVGLFQSILARFKIMSEMNIAERRVPQDGKIQASINGNVYDFRASTIPTINGEKLVIRIFNKNLQAASFESLGLYPEQIETLLRAITRPHGIMLLTGPTGSGKSSTLYACLRYLNKEDTNIITVEDPVENVIQGVNQVQVNAKANMTFASALRSILRQDPNIIMIGEIRDEETAQIATRAAITGHLVMSTIHTNSAAGVVTRLINMGIPNYLVADSLLCSISQRLVRRLCPNCKELTETNQQEMRILGINEPKMIYKPVGCPSCNKTGYLGRTAIYEIVPISNQLRALIMDEEFEAEKLESFVKNNYETLLDNAKKRVLSGDTSIEEFEDLCEFISEE